MNRGTREKKEKTEEKDQPVSTRKKNNKPEHSGTKISDQDDDICTYEMKQIEKIEVCDTDFIVNRNVSSESLQMTVNIKVGDIPFYFHICV
jgi:hypothetical protein